MKNTFDDEDNHSLFDESVLGVDQGTDTSETKSLLPQSFEDDFVESLDEGFQANSIGVGVREEQEQAQAPSILSGLSDENDSDLQIELGKLSAPPAFGNLDDVDDSPDQPYLEIDDVIRQIQAMTDEHEFEILKEAILSGLHKAKAIELAELHQKNPLPREDLKKATEALIKDPKTPARIIFDALLTSQSVKLQTFSQSVPNPQTVQPANSIQSVGIDKSNNSQIPFGSISNPLTNMGSAASQFEGKLGQISDDSDRASQDVSLKNTAEAANSIAKDMTLKGVRSIGTMGAILAGALYGGATGAVVGLVEAFRGKSEKDLTSSETPSNLTESQISTPSELFEKAIVEAKMRINELSVNNTEFADTKKALMEVENSALAYLGSAQVEDDAEIARDSIGTRLKDIRDQLLNAALPEDKKKELIEFTGGILDLIQQKVEELYLIVKEKIVSAIRMEEKDTDNLSL